MRISYLFGVLLWRVQSRAPDPVLVQKLFKACEANFLECDKSEKRPQSLDVRAGTFGAGVGATLRNEPESTGVKVYRNCLMEKGIPQCTEQQLIDDEQVRVFIKMGIVAKVNHETSFDTHLRAQGTTGWQAEVDRVAMFARAGFGPAVYAVRRAQDDMGHSIHSEAYIMENLGPLTVRKTVKRIINELESLGVEKLVPGEFLWRLRMLMRITEEIVAFSVRLHKAGLAHCDLHPNNLMFRASPVNITNPAVFHHLIQERRRNSILLFSEEEIPVVANHSTPPEGVEWLWVMQIKPEDLMAIDASFGLNITEFQSSLDQDVPVPCRLHSACRAEDVAELYKHFESILFGLERVHDKMLDANPSDLDIVGDAIDEVLAIHEKMPSAPANPAWDDCVLSNVKFKIERKKRSLKHRREWCREGYLTLPPCTWQGQSLALETAERLLKEASADIPV